MHEVPIEDSIDLHAFQPREIQIVVDEYLHQAAQRGFSEVRIIHGRGIGVQRELVRSILEKHPEVTAFRDAPDRGSTYATLRGLQNLGDGSDGVPVARCSRHTDTLLDLAQVADAPQMPPID